MALLQQLADVCEPHQVSLMHAASLIRLMDTHLHVEGELAREAEVAVLPCNGATYPRKCTPAQGTLLRQQGSAGTSCILDCHMCLVDRQLLMAAWTRHVVWCVVHQQASRVQARPLQSHDSKLSEMYGQSLEQQHTCQR